MCISAKRVDRSTKRYSVVDKGDSPVNINKLLLIIRRSEDKQHNCRFRKNF